MLLRATEYVCKKGLAGREFLAHTFDMTKTELEEQERRIGRPPLPDDQRKVTASVRLTPARWAKLKRLGMDWLSKAIDKAKEPGA